MFVLENCLFLQRLLRNVKLNFEKHLNLNNIKEIWLFTQTFLTAEQAVFKFAEKVSLHLLI